ncbi:helix-turn-helix domain-containing protein [Planomonospora venezuelensis]|uniref:Transcriptional regulator with XRE-family HTH domain n=1 Tax=Planomonospora venezuelensis TaxID=1999 RepID=A0A841D4B2_PLAVE|nr:helix-turn-helix transcriptional regulator [Planomonospora venezuelensis]MBB5965091.1 transcriptional regulator with XRE-family HTH domain [Planomonospora venezuelensis]GIN04991.1 hypothetical protein Pve01_66490 [Planomonospora venezuelensis]
MQKREGRHDHAPGRPLWERAEQIRVERGWSQEELAERAGIGRVTLARLKTQANKPQARTVNKLADAIGISHREAGILSGLIGIEAQTAGFMLDADTDLSRRSIIEPDAARHIQTLREAGRSLGRTLGDVLVLTGLAEPEELRLSNDPLVRELVNDPELPDDVRAHLRAVYL